MFKLLTAEVRKGIAPTHLPLGCAAVGDRCGVLQAVALEGEQVDVPNPGQNRGHFRRGPGKREADRVELASNTQLQACPAAMLAKDPALGSGGAGSGAQDLLPGFVRSPLGHPLVRKMYAKLAQAARSGSFKVRRKLSSGGRSQFPTRRDPCFGSTRSQVRILSPRLTFQGLAKGHVSKQVSKSPLCSRVLRVARSSHRLGTWLWRAR